MIGQIFILFIKYFIDDNLLIGKLISQGANRAEVLGAARSAGIVNQVESVKVRGRKLPD